MRGIFEIMLGKLEAYQFIAPHVCLVCRKTQLLVEHLTEGGKEGVHSEAVVKGVEARVHVMFEEAMRQVNGHIQSAVQEIGSVIKHELKKAMAKEILHYMSPERK